MGRSQPNIVIDVQAPVTHAAIVAAMEREMGHPPLKRSNDDVSVRHELDAAPTGGHMHPIMVRWKMRGMKEDFPMTTYHMIRGQILVRVPGIDPADISSLLRMLVSAARGPEWRDVPQVRHALAGLETLWVEEIADLQEAIAAQRQDGLTHGLTEPETEAEVLASLRREFMCGEIPRPWS